MKWPPCMGMEYMDDSWCFIREGFGMFFALPHSFLSAKQRMKHVRQSLCVLAVSHRILIRVH